MLLQPDPTLAEVPGFSREQLDSLARSVESRRQQLESDIQDYIRAKQSELRSYEGQLVEQHRSMECVENDGSAEQHPRENAQKVATSPTPQPPSSQHADVHPEPHEKSKRTKYTRVHKREKELYGLVTPVFLPLLDAHDTSPTAQENRKEKKQSKPEPSGDADNTASPERAASLRHAEKSKEGRTSRKENKDMEGAVSGEPVKQSPQIDAVKKSKRAGVKKSALRHKDTPRSRRKRVSLVIDGQTVLPADTVVDMPPTSPSSEATSASNSTTSLDELIDPRLTRPDFNHDAVHHSLPLSMYHSHSSSKPLAETPTSITNEAEHSPPLNMARSSSVPFAPPPAATRTFLDPSPSLNQPLSLPRTAGPDPIYPQPASSEVFESDSLFAEAEEEDEEASAPHWDTYVGGLHGSGVADVDQAGSYGYPSSLGASYLESYMQSRPLSVRMQAVDKAGLDEREKREMLRSRRNESHGPRHQFADDDDDVDDDVVGDEEFSRRDEFKNSQSGRRRVDDDDDMDITGSMEF